MKPETELPDLTDNEVVERIAKTDLKPMYDTSHEHQYIQDLTDQTDDYVAEICSVKNCNMGRLVAKVH